MATKKQTRTIKREKIRNVFSADELLPKREFLVQKRIRLEDFEKTGLSWEELTNIYKDYVTLKPKLEHPAKAIVDILFTKNAREKGVHSVRFRIKDANGLIEKIIKKRIKEPDRIITIKNYQEHITDLIGVRALHVYKHDIYGIHNFIMDMFALKVGEFPIHYYREGDDRELIKMCGDIGCKQEKHEKGYRSVHYIVSTQLTKEKYYVEIQVRTVFEEGWSEIDHKIRYSYKSDAGTVFDDHLNNLNRVSGQADEIGLSIKRLEQKEQERILAPKTKRRKK